MIRTLLSATALITLAGCSAFGGKSSFDCPATQAGATCLSARQVYVATHVSDRVQPNYRDGKPIEQPSKGTDSPDGQAATVVARVDDYRPPYPEVDAPLPVRNPAKVMRIRLFPWEDNARDLNTGGFIFTEVAGRTWTLGEEQVSRIQSNVVSPLAVPANRNSSSTSMNSSPLQLPVNTGMPAQRQQQQGIPAPAAKSGQANSGLPSQPK